MTAHRFEGRLGRPAHHWYCVRCGLVLLSNKASRKAAARPCPEKDE